jgi:hypothetical protein
VGELTTTTATTNAPCRAVAYDHPAVRGHHKRPSGDRPKDATIKRKLWASP